MSFESVDKLVEIGRLEVCKRLRGVVEMFKEGFWGERVKGEL